MNVSSTEQPDVNLLRTVRADASARTGVPVPDIIVVSTSSVVWPDTALGMPVPGMAYAQMMTAGWKIAIQAGETRLLYHTDETSRFVCASDNG